MVGVVRPGDATGDCRSTGVPCRPRPESGREPTSLRSGRQHAAVAVTRVSSRPPTATPWRVCSSPQQSLRPAPVPRGAHRFSPTFHRPPPTAHQFVEKKDKYDYARTLRMGSFGLLIHGTTGHYFYGALDGALPGTAPVTVASKVGSGSLLRRRGSHVPTIPTRHPSQLATLPPP